MGKAAIRCVASVAGVVAVAGWPAPAAALLDCSITPMVTQFYQLKRNETCKTLYDRRQWWGCDQIRDERGRVFRPPSLAKIKAMNHANATNGFTCPGAAGDMLCVPSLERRNQAGQTICRMVPRR